MKIAYFKDGNHFHFAFLYIKKRVIICQKKDGQSPDFAIWMEN